MMGWYDGGSGGWGGWIVMSLVMVAFWALAIFALVALFRGSARHGESAPPPPRRDPLQILEERFAGGEIDEEEYRTRAAVLRGRPPVASARDGQ